MRKFSILFELKDTLWDGVPALFSICLSKNYSQTFMSMYYFYIYTKKSYQHANNINCLNVYCVCVFLTVQHENEQMKRTFCILFCIFKFCSCYFSQCFSDMCPCVHYYFLLIFCNLSTKM